MTTPNQTKRKMPTKKQIAEHWAKKLVRMGKFDSVEEVMDDLNVCWACGMKIDSKDWESETERAHILPRIKGGCDEPHNLHLLDYVCHKKSENLWGKKYDEWFKNRKFTHVMFENAPGEKIELLIKEMEKIWTR